MRSSIVLSRLDLVACVVSALAIAPAAESQPMLAPTVPSADGPVLTSVLVGNNLVIGGAFQNLGPPTGGAAIVDGTTAILAPGFPDVNGAVLAIEDDGAGGWYLGGTFSMVGGQPRQNLAHVLADGSVDAWSTSTNGPVLAMDRNGTTVYIGGQFDTVGGLGRSGLAAINGATGAVTSWDPDAGGEVAALAFSGTTIYAGGSFTTIGGQPRSYLAAIRANNGNPTAWNPGPDGPLYAIAVGGSTVYVGGSFANIGTFARGRIAAIDATTGVPTEWNPSADLPVLALAVSGPTVYAGGSFLNVGGAPRSRLAAIDAASGSALPWIADASGPVSALALAGSLLYVGGQFTSIAGQPRPYAASVDAATAAVTPWSPRVDARVTALGAGASTVALGGYFVLTNVTSRSNLAAIDATTGQLTDWNPGANSVVYALTAIGETVFAGGAFGVVGGQSRTRLAAIDAATGVVSGWSPAITGGFAPGGDPYTPIVYSLAISDNTVFVGGRFGSLGGHQGEHLGAVSATMGTATGFGSVWGQGPDFWVGDVATDGERAYSARGMANRVAGKPIAPGNEWFVSPSPLGSGGRALLIHEGTLYVGGAFAQLDGDPRANLAALDPVTGARLPWDPGADGAVLSFAEASGNLYVGGVFANIAGVPRTGLAALDRVSGTATSWSPVLDGRAVHTIQVAGSTVFAGGEFLTVNGRMVRSLVAFQDPSLVSAPAPTAGRSLALGPVSPQPMRESARVHFSLPRSGPASLTLVDVGGRRVRSLLDGERVAGPQAVELQRQGLPSGLYFLRLRAAGQRVTHKLLLLD